MSMTQEENLSTGLTDWIWSDFGDDMALELVPGVNPALALCCKKCEVTIGVEVVELARMFVELLARTGNKTLSLNIGALIDEMGIEEP